MKKLIIFLSVLSVALTSCQPDILQPELQSTYEYTEYPNGWTEKTLSSVIGYNDFDIYLEIDSDSTDIFLSTGHVVGHHWRHSDSVAEVWSTVIYNNVSFQTMIEVIYTPTQATGASQHTAIRDLPYQVTLQLSFDTLINRPLYFLTPSAELSQK